MRLTGQRTVRLISKLCGSVLLLRLAGPQSYWSNISVQFFDYFASMASFCYLYPFSPLVLLRLYRISDEHTSADGWSRFLGWINSLWPAGRLLCCKRAGVGPLASEKMHAHAQPALRPKND